MVEPGLDLGPEHAHRHEERHQDDGRHGAGDQDQDQVGHLATAGGQFNRKILALVMLEKLLDFEQERSKLPQVV